MNVNTYLLKKNVILCNQKECQCLLPLKSQYIVALKDWQHTVVTQKYFRQKDFEKCPILFREAFNKKKTVKVGILSQPVRPPSLPSLLGNS